MNNISLGLAVSSIVCPMASAVANEILGGRLIRKVTIETARTMGMMPIFGAIMGVALELLLGNKQQDWNWQRIAISSVVIPIALATASGATLAQAVVLTAAPSFLFLALMRTCVS